MNKENPRYVNNLLYFLKPNYKFEVASKINIIQLNGHQQLLVNSEKLPVLKTFSLPAENNKWRIKNRDPKKGTYTLRNNLLDAYIEVSYDAIAAFPVEMPELSNINTSSLIEENTTFRQELFQKETELQELQLKFEELKWNHRNHLRRSNYLTTIGGANMSLPINSKKPANRTRKLC